jgi:hypothetical protein
MTRLGSVALVVALAAGLGCDAPSPPRPCNNPSCFSQPSPGPQPTVFVGTEGDAVPLVGPVHRVPASEVEGERIVFTEMLGDVIGFCADPLNEDQTPPALPKPADVTLPTYCDEQMRYDELLNLCGGVLTLVVVDGREGDDTGDGSPAAPLRTLEAAAAVCEDGCCHWLLGPGDYVFDGTLRIPEGTFVEGAVAVDPETAIAIRVAERPSIAGDVELRANTVLARVIVNGPDYALFAGDDPLVSEVTARGRYSALAASRGVGASVCASTLQAYTNGLHLSSSASYLRVAGSAFSACAKGISLSSASDVEVRDATVYGAEMGIMLWRGTTDTRIANNRIVGEEHAVFFFPESTTWDGAIPDTFNIEIVDNAVRGSLPEHDPSLGVTVADNTALD